LSKPITEERAERIAKSHACEKCGEYSYKRVTVVPASQDRRDDLGVAWIAEKVCGVCDTENELGIAEDGRVVYVS
jgi:hypothetical protein